MKRRNPKFGCVRIAQQIPNAFGIEIDKDVVRRVLAKYHRPEPLTNGPSWLTFIGHAKDSLWSVDLFRVESILLRSHWVMLVMDVFTRRIIGFGVAPASIDGVSLCRMFNHATTGQPQNDTSVPITIRYFGFTVGSPICEYLRLMKSSQFHTPRFPIRSSNG
jgi:putative transposase